MTIVQLFARTSSVIFMDLSKYSRAQYFRPQIGAFHWALCVVWFTYPMKKPRVLCKSAKGGKRSIMYDIIIRNGRVIDPQNKFDAKADVAIYNGKIVGVGDYQNAESDRVLDAAGHIVTPGLIDAHAHLWPLTKMGISTECTCIPSAVTTADRRRQRRLGDLRDEPRLHQHLQGARENVGQRQPHGPAVQRIP